MGCNKSRPFTGIEPDGIGSEPKPDGTNPLAGKKPDGAKEVIEQGDSPGRGEMASVCPKVADVPHGTLNQDALRSRMTSKQLEAVDEFISGLNDRGIPVPDLATCLRSVRFCDLRVKKAVDLYAAHSKWYSLSQSITHLV